MTHHALRFMLTATNAAGTISDETKVAPVPDTMAITTARWKLGDFRVVGTRSVAACRLGKGPTAIRSGLPVVFGD